MNIVKKALFLLIGILCITYNDCTAFSTLSELQKYAIEYQEYPTGNIDWVNPDYSSYHNKITRVTPSILRYFMNKRDIARNLQAKLTNYLATIAPSLITQAINTDIKRTVSLKLQKKLTKYLAPLQPAELAQEKIVKINSDTARVFVWGDVHAAFHSVIRCLAWLHEEKIINENLEIIKPDNYFVFNGDLVNRSPYNMEMLILILTLIQKNPDKVFYICGAHEYKGYWRNFSLKQELRIRAKHLSNEQIPLGKEIDAFFATLPFAVYLSNPNHPTNVIRISHFSRTSDTIDEQKCGTFFTDTKPGLSFYDIKQEAPCPEHIDVVALITTENWKEMELVKDGLILLEQDLGSITWGVFSSPTQVYQNYTNFFYDSFASIQVATPIEKSTITLINRDVRTKDNFMVQEPLNIMSGMPAKDPRSYSGKPNIILGSSMSLVQGVPVMGKNAKQGLMTRINKENSEQGGINGQLLRVVVKNDDYTPSKTRKNILEFIDRGINITLLQIGTPTLSAYIDLIKEGKLLALFPITGNPLFYTADSKGIINYRANYSDEVHALINYIYTDRGDRSFAFFYQNDSYGISPLDTAHNSLEKLDIKGWTDIPYVRGSADLKEQAKKIKEAQSEALGLFSTAQPTQELIRQLGVDQIVNKDLFGISFLGEESFRQFIKKHGIPVTFGAVVPNPRTSKLEIVEEYRTEMQKNTYSYSVFSLEAYIATSILIEALKMIDGPITMESVKAKLESFNDVDIKGLRLTYDQKHHSLAKYVYLETSDEHEWIREEIRTLN